MPVLLIGTLDTKGTEVGFLRDLLHGAGVETLVVDTGIMGTPTIPADISREELFRGISIRLTPCVKREIAGKQ